jgi:hypothetical protein
MKKKNNRKYIYLLTVLITGLGAYSAYSFSENPLYGHWVAAYDLKPKDRFMLADGGEAVVECITEQSNVTTKCSNGSGSASPHSDNNASSLTTSCNRAPEKTYNFKVADWHTYHVGENGAWVHNTGNSCAGSRFRDLTNEEMIILTDNKYLARWKYFDAYLSLNEHVLTLKEPIKKLLSEARNLRYPKDSSRRNKVLRNRHAKLLLNLKHVQDDINLCSTSLEQSVSRRNALLEILHKLTREEIAKRMHEIARPIAWTYPMLKRNYDLLRTALPKSGLREESWKTLQDLPKEPDFIFH